MFDPERIVRAYVAHSGVLNPHGSAAASPQSDLHAVTGGGEDPITTFAYEFTRQNRQWKLV